MAERTWFFLLAGAIASQAFGAHNQLTPQETRAGYVSLFNGKDLSGWTALDQNQFIPWKVVPESTWGVLTDTRDVLGGPATEDSTFKNFDLKIEWAISVQGISGIGIRYFFRDPWGVPNFLNDAAGPTAMTSDSAGPTGHSIKQSAGACYDMFPVKAEYRYWNLNGSKDAQGKDIYRYNQFRIIAFGRHVAHYGNGRKLLEYEIHSPAWDTQFQLSRFRPYPLYGDVHPGRIFLLNHVGNARYRDIRIKNLGDSAAFNPWSPGSPYLKDPKDTASGLKETLTFEDNLYPEQVPTGIRPMPPAPSQSGRGGSDPQGILFEIRNGARSRISDPLGRIIPVPAGSSKAR